MKTHRHSRIAQQLLLGIVLAGSTAACGGEPVSDDAIPSDQVEQTDALTEEEVDSTSAALTTPWSCLPAYARPASRDAATWPFASSSAWNRSMGSGAQFTGASDACTQALSSTPNGMGIAGHRWSQPVWIAKSSDRTVTLTQQGSAYASNVRCPSNAAPALPPISEGGDTNLNIIDPTHHTLFESWRAKLSGRTWDAAYWNTTDLYGPGHGIWGIRAYGGSTIAGEIRAGEFRNGIRHALAFAVDVFLQKDAYVWPAINNDGHPARLYKGVLPMGQLMGIPPHVDLCKLGLSPGGLVFARALQDYGAYLVDSSGGLAFYAEPSIEDNASLGERQLLNEARNDLRKIMTYTRCVKNNRADNIGGGGTRRAPRAPELR